MKITENLLKQSVIFCGAGISLDPPAGLPDWRKLRDNTLQAIAEQDAFLDKYLNKLVNTPMWKEKALHPGVVASQIASVTSGYFDCFKVLKKGEPNTNHYYLAKMAKLGICKIIITTNFDMFIEEAFKKEAPDIVLDVVKTEDDFERYLNRLKNSEMKNHVSLLKIHGCLDMPETIITTLEQTGKGLGLYKKSALKELLKRYWFIFWGYSGNDLKLDLDYFALESMHKEAVGFIWNFHEVQDDNFREIPPREVEDLKLIYGQERACITHGMFPKVFSRLLPQEEIIHPNLSTKEQSKKFVTEKNEQIFTELKNWASKHLNCAASHIFGNLFRYLKLKDEATDCFQQSYNVATEYSITANQCASLNNIALVHSDFSEYSKAEELFKKAIELEESTDEQAPVLYSHKIASLGGLGAILIETERYEDALPFYLEAFDIWKKHYLSHSAIPAQMGFILNSLGHIYSAKQDFHKAIEYYKEGIRFCKITGDILAKVGIINNLGTVYGYLKDFDKALKYHQEAVELSEKIGSIQHLFSCYNNLANVYLRKGDFDKAESFWEKSEKIAKESGNILDQLRLQEYKFSLERNVERKKLLEMLSIYKEMNNKRGILRMLLSLSVFNEDAESSYQNCREALEIAKDLGKREYAQCLMTFGELEYKTGKHKEGIRVLEEAASIYDECSFPEEQTTCLLILMEKFWEQEKRQSYQKILKKLFSLDLSPMELKSIVGFVMKNITSIKDTKDWSDLVDCLDASFKVAKKINHTYLLAQTASVLMHFYSIRGDFRKSFELAQEIEPFIDYIEDIEDIVTSLSNIGLVYKKKGNFQKALACYEKVMGFNNLANLNGYVTAISNMARLYQEMGDPIKAAEYANKAEKLYTQCEDRTVGVCCNTLATMYGLQKKFDQAEIYFKKALEIFTKINDESEIAKTQKNIGIHYRNTGKTKLGKEYLSKAFTFFDRFENSPIAQEIHKQIRELEKCHTPIRKAKEVGRNDPCPCGSHKKYKKCCG